MYAIAVLFFFLLILPVTHLSLLWDMTIYSKEITYDKLTASCQTNMSDKDYSI